MLFFPRLEALRESARFKMEHMIISELETAASTLMAPAQAVTSEERHAAEQIILGFRKTKQPYSLCRYILENCQVDYVLFESATTLKEAIIREWNMLQKQDIDDLSAFLLNYITQKKTITKFVREQILQVVAMIFKRGTLDKSKDGCGDLLKNVSHLLQTGDKDMQMICCSIMKALLTEYSSTAQSANLGLSLEYHAECKSGFESSNLLTIFLLCKNILENFADASTGFLTRIDTALLIRYLSLAEQVLNWNFLSGNPFQLLRLSNETAKINLFRPSKSWQSTVVDPEFLSLFFKLYNRCLGHEELVHHSLQCLIQLASVTGPVFANQQLRVAYLSCYIQGFAHLMNRNSWTALEAFGYASIVSRIINVFPISVISSLSQEVLNSFSNIMTSLTCIFLELTMKKDENELDSNQYEDAVDLLLDALVILVSNLSCFPDNYFVPSAVQIFNAYVKTHLAEPDGIRTDDTDSSQVAEIDCDVEEDDRFAYADELSDIGYLARLALSHALPMLSTLFDARTQQLISSLKRAPGHNIDSLFEDIHWLFLMATNVLTMDWIDDRTCIPSDILEYEAHCQQKGETDVHASVEYISKLGRGCGSDKVSNSIMLITKILNLAEYLCGAMKNGLEQALSPEIASDVLWFLQCWSSSYLFLKEDKASGTPDVFKSTFGESSACGAFLIGVALDIAETSLLHMQAEPAVAVDSVQVFTKIFYKDSRIKSALEFPNLWRLAELQSQHSVQLDKLPVDAHRHLVEALIKGGSRVEDAALREKFLSTLLGRFQTEYDAIKSHLKCTEVSQQETVRRNLISFLESLRGITLASDSKNVEMIFKFLSPYLSDIPHLLENYAGCSDVVELIFCLFVDVIKSETMHLGKEDCNDLCDLCVQLIVTYSKHNIGRVSALHSSEDESYQEILLVIRLLTHMLAKDYIDFSYLEIESEDGIKLNAIDAVFHGLYVIIPLMTAELLKFPKLSSEYFKLVTFVCECYPEKIEQLPDDLFHTFIKSLEMALLHFGSDAAKNSYEALASIAAHYFRVKSQCKAVPPHMDISLKHFLKVVFELILGNNFDMDLLQSASETLFKLICVYQEEYMALAQGLLASQKDSAVTERLRTAFSELTPATLKLSMDKSYVTEFRKNLEKFLLEIKGFLFFK